MPHPLTEGFKWCAHCKRNQRITQFPVDRFRRDGRWHSCKRCGRRSWHERGKQLRAERRDRQHRESQQLQGLVGLQLYYSHQDPQERFARLPPSLRPKAEVILSRSLEHARREGRPLTQALFGLFHAAAASNAPRLGSKSFPARMNAHKRWKRERER